MLGSEPHPCAHLVHHVAVTHEHAVQFGTRALRRPSASTTTCGFFPLDEASDEEHDTRAIRDPELAAHLGAQDGVRALEALRVHPVRHERGCARPPIASRRSGARLDLRADEHLVGEAVGESPRAR